jgi:hypothetical protein
VLLGGLELNRAVGRRAARKGDSDRYRVRATLGRKTTPTITITAISPVLKPHSKIEIRRGSCKISRIRVVNKDEEEENPIPLDEVFSAMNHHLARPVRHSA